MANSAGCAAAPCLSKLCEGSLQIKQRDRILDRPVAVACRAAQHGIAWNGPPSRRGGRWRRDLAIGARLLDDHAPFRFAHALEFQPAGVRVKVGSQREPAAIGSGASGAMRSLASIKVEARLRSRALTTGLADERAKRGRAVPHGGLSTQRRRRS